MSDAIFIAGYYRSGTSALAGALQCLGVSLHNDAEANEHNPLGFYEIPELIELDVDIFAHLGVDWTDVRGLPAGWETRADMARFLVRLDEILRRRFSADPLWGIKHPHLCRLFPLYERAVTQAGHRPHVIHICRAPWTVAASQQRKNGLARAHALLLWLSYLIDAERHARHLPRSWLTYQDLLADPAVQLHRIERDLDLELCQRVPGGLAKARGALTAQLNRSEPVPTETLFRPLQSLVETVWDAVQARDFSAPLWDGFAAASADIAGFLAEIGQSRGAVVPGFGATGLAPANLAAEQNNLRPAERLDAGAKQRLLALAEAVAEPPRLHVLIAVPPARAHAIHDTLEQLRAQWLPPADVTIVSAEALEIPGYATIIAPAESGAVTSCLCAAANAAAANADYIALLNAGDTIAPDGCLRFMLEAAGSAADLIYSDEIVQGESGAWVRHKPAWDVTRLRQAAYLGDWVWYRTKTLLRLGGFDPEYAGVEEYELQLRLAEAGAKTVRLPEAVFTRARLSRRDNIPSTEFGPRAVRAVTAHLDRIGIPAEVGPRQHLGLFQHARKLPDPGTSIILLCAGADIATLGRWMTNLLTASVLTGPVILAGHDLSPQVQTYLGQVVAQAAALQDKVQAVPPGPLATASSVLAAALARVPTEHVTILDACSAPMTPHWLDALRGRLADPGVAMAGARSLLPLARDAARFTVQGPLIMGADTRLGAGHLADDPGPGGWLAVDQEASAIAPALLARRDALAGCVFGDLAGDALWIDLCAQLRAAGHRIVWTPDISFIVTPDTIRPDPGCRFRAAADAGAAFEDRYHHPALSLRGDLLAREQRHGLVRSAPADPYSVLLSGPAQAALPVLNVVRALRGAGRLEASWSPEPLLLGEIARRAAASWVRINPSEIAPAGSPPYTAIFTEAPKPEARAVLAGAQSLAATSPGLVQCLRGMLPPGRPVSLWRPVISRTVWQDLTFGTGLNTKPRVLWIDEGLAPAWFADFINDTLETASWIVVERPGTQYAGAIARLRPPEDEQGWARELGALAPHIMVRPADGEASADHYKVLLGAAGGCHLLADERFDLPATLGATRLGNRMSAWQRALRTALENFQATLEKGKAARAACLALPAAEDALPPWLAGAESEPLHHRAAE